MKVQSDYKDTIIISVLNVLTETQDQQKLVCEVTLADAIFPGNVFFTYTKVYNINGGS